MPRKIFKFKLFKNTSSSVRDDDSTSSRRPLRADDYSNTDNSVQANVNNASPDEIQSSRDVKLEQKYDRRIKRTEKRIKEYNAVCNVKGKEQETIIAAKRYFRSLKKQNELELELLKYSNSKDKKAKIQNDLEINTNAYELYKDAQYQAYMYSESGGTIKDVNAFVEKVKMQRDAPLVNNQQSKQHP